MLFSGIEVGERWSGPTLLEHFYEVVRRRFERLTIKQKTVRYHRPPERTAQYSHVVRALPGWQGCQSKALNRSGQLPPFRLKAIEMPAEVFISSRIFLRRLDKISRILRTSPVKNCF
jgi:hypothetical protein